MQASDSPLFLNKLSNQECPWMVLEKHPLPGTEKQSYVKASLHLQEIIFTSQAIIEKRLSQGLAMETEELRNFRKNALPAYLSLLANLQTQNKENPPFVEFNSSLIAQFRKMESALRHKKFEDASSAFKQLQTLLKTYTIAVEKIYTREI